MRPQRPQRSAEERPSSARYLPNAVQWPRVPAHRGGAALALLVGVCTAALVVTALDRALASDARTGVHTAVRPHSGTADTAAWMLAWSDEFEGQAGQSANASSWTFDTGDGCAAQNCGWGNSERQYYRDDRDNAALTGLGALAITARVAPAGLHCWYGPCRYTSAKLKTQGKVTPRFGRVEARIKLPTGQGLWPAFWMLGAGFPEVGWPDCGEIDIMEHHGSMPGDVSSAMHGPGYSGNTPFVHHHAPPAADFPSDFHRYGVEWDSTAVRFSVDDSVHYVVRRGEVSTKGAWAFDRPFYIILNLAVGGTFDGDPRSDAVLPATMLVDYVRVYERPATKAR